PPAEAVVVPPPDIEPLLRDLRALCAERRYCLDPEDRLAQYLEGLEGEVDRLAAPADGMELLRRLRGGKWRFSQGRKGNWPRRSKDEIIESINELEAERQALV